MRKFLLLFLILRFSAFAQNTDSLTKIWNNKAVPDTLRMDAMITIARKFVFSNPDTGFALAGEIRKLALASSQKRWESMAYNLMGLSFYVKGDYEKALGYYEKSMVLNESLIASENKFVSAQGKAGLAKIYNNIGNIFLDKGNYPKALSYYLSSLRTVEELSDKPAEATALANVGMVYGIQGSYNKSLSYLIRGLRLDEELGDKQGKANDLNNIGNVYLSKKDYDKASEYQMQSLKMREEMNDKQGISSSYSNLGNICFAQAETLERSGEQDLAFQTYYPKALDFQLKSLKFYEEVGDKKGLATVYASIGVIKNKLGQPDEALSWCEKSRSMAIGIGALAEERDACNCLYKGFKAKGNINESFRHFERYIRLRDTLVNEERTREITQHQFEFEYEKKAAADSVKVAEEKKTVGLKLEHERTQRYALYGGLALVMVFAGFMFNRFKVTQEKNRIIARQKQEVEEKQKEILDSIQYANRIQKTVLANEELLNANLPQHFVFFKPKDIVSGDFYWSTHKNGLFYLAVCDSTGHGVPGAFMSLLNISFLNEAVNEKNMSLPHEIFNYVRERLIANVSQEGARDGMDAVLICMDKANKSITYASANNAPVLIRDRKIVDLPADKMPVGKGERHEPFALRKIEIKEGDCLYLFTDGFADQFGGPEGKKFKSRQLKELLLQIHQQPLSDQHDLLQKTFGDWKGALEQVDDVAMIGLRI